MKLCLAKAVRRMTAIMSADWRCFCYHAHHPHETDTGPGLIILEKSVEREKDVQAIDLDSVKSEPRHWRNYLPEVTKIFTQ